MPATSESRRRGRGASRRDRMDTDASESEAIDALPGRRLRKPSAKAKQSEKTGRLFEDALLSSDDQNGEAAQPAVGARNKRGHVGDEQTPVPTIQSQMEEQTNILKTLLNAWMKQEAHNKTLEAEVGLIKQELQAVKVECQAVKDELRRTKQEMADGIAALASAQSSSPRMSYAEVARTLPTSQPENVQTLLSFNTTPSNFTNTLYCTIDTSRVEIEVSDQVSARAIRTMVEKRMRNNQDNATWRCRAVIVDPKNPHRVEMACRNETEHKTVKQAVEANLVQGARILRDDLYPIRVDSANRTVVLDETVNIRTGATDALSEENDTQAAKIAWLSNRAVPKAYGSMVVYLTKGVDARRFLPEGFSMLEGSQDTPKLLNAESAQIDAITARNSPATRLTSVVGIDTQALHDTSSSLRKIIQEVRRKASTVVELVIEGDFNRHDQLWRGDEVSMERQGEADLIIDLMNEFTLNSLLRRGTKTWHGGAFETTIDLVLASEELENAMVKCTLYGTEHSSDHRTIETTFDISVPTLRPQERLLLKNAPWKEINARIANSLGLPCLKVV